MSRKRLRIDIKDNNNPDNPINPTIPVLKKNKTEGIYNIKNILIRNDFGPHVLVNINDFTHDYVIIGEYVYRAIRFDENWQWNDRLAPSYFVGLTETQFSDVFDFVNDKMVLVSSFKGNVSNATSFNVHLKNISGTEIITPKDKITKDIINFLCGHIIGLNQNFILSHQGRHIKITISDIEDGILAKIHPRSILNFENVDPSISISEACFVVSSRSVRINVIKAIATKFNVPIETKNYFIPINTVTPIIVNRNFIIECIKNAFENPFQNGDIIIYTMEHIEFEFRIIIMDPMDRNSKFKIMYTLGDIDESLPIITNHNLDIVDSRQVANEICFRLNSLSNFVYRPEDYIVQKNILLNYIQRNIKLLTDTTIFKIPHENIFFEIEVKYIQPATEMKVIYEITSETDISFDIYQKSGFIIVENIIPHIITDITLKFKYEEKNLLELKRNKDKHFDMKILNKLALDMFKKISWKTAKGHKLNFRYDEIYYNLVVKDIKIHDSVNTNTYNLVGLVTEKTNFRFEPGKNNIRLFSDTREILQYNSLEILESYVGGLSEQITNIIKSICLSRGKLREEFLIRGIKPVKGIIFYGPTGTGKTTLARHLGEFLGCDKEHFKLISGPEILNKYGDQPEVNLSEIFRPAKEAWKRHREQSSVYVTVIDEIDAIIPPRKYDYPDRQSIINQFLAELDGLEEFNNFVLIGITNRFDMLDEAAIRPGRLGIHIKFDLPNKEGRIKIFKIYLKKLAISGRSDENKLDYDQLASLTDKFSGADIESVVLLASTYTLERLDKLSEITEEAIKDIGKVTQDDLIKAINYASKQKKDNNFKSLHIYL